ncbi:unnamed protein product [Camellia sinensis]
MRPAISIVSRVLHKFREKQKVIGVESVMNYAIHKSKELPAAVGNIGGNLMDNAADKWKELSPELGKLGGKVVEKSKELPTAVENIGGNLMDNSADKWKELSPELGKVVEKSKELPGMIGRGVHNTAETAETAPNRTAKANSCLTSRHGAAGKLIIIMREGTFNCFYVATGGGKLVVKMMKAPGRSYMKIPSHVFESNPRGYFRGLRGKP